MGRIITRMIYETNEGGVFMVLCDNPGCAGEEEVDTAGDFSNAVLAVKAKGWKVYKDRGEWYHSCSVCVGEKTEDE